MADIILYSMPECIRCQLVKQMLDAHDVSYTEINDRQVFEAKEIENVPVLEVDGKIMEYHAILTWLKQNNYYSLWKEDDNESNLV